MKKKSEFADMWCEFCGSVVKKHKTYRGMMVHQNINIPHDTVYILNGKLIAGDFYKI